MVRSAVTPGLARRLLCLIYESILLVGTVFIGFLMPHVAFGIVVETVVPHPLLILHFVALIATYFLWHWRRHGQTLAMQTWKIKLISANGKTVDWSRLILRLALAGPSILSGIGILWALYDRERQFLHDRLVGTRLVRV